MTTTTQTECTCTECTAGRPDGCLTVERTRYVVRYEDTGMVVGEGETEAAAWEDADSELADGAGSTAHQDEGGRDGLEAVAYDARTHGERMIGGIVVLAPRR